MQTEEFKAMLLATLQQDRKFADQVHGLLAGAAFYEDEKPLADHRRIITESFRSPPYYTPHVQKMLHSLQLPYKQQVVGWDGAYTLFTVTGPKQVVNEVHNRARGKSREVPAPTPDELSAAAAAHAEHVARTSPPREVADANGESRTAGLVGVLRRWLVGRADTPSR